MAAAAARGREGRNSRQLASPVDTKTSVRSWMCRGSRNTVCMCNSCGANDDSDWGAWIMCPLESRLMPLGWYRFSIESSDQGILHTLGCTWASSGLRLSASYLRRRDQGQGHPGLESKGGCTFLSIGIHFDTVDLLITKPPGTSRPGSRRPSDPKE